MPFSARLGFQFASAIPGATFIPDYPTQPTEAQYLHTLDSMSATAPTVMADNITPNVTMHGYSLVAHTDGNIYMPPRVDNGNFVKFDVTSNTLISMSSTATTNTYQGATLGLNGNIYLSPFASNNIGEYDPSTDTLTQPTLSGGPASPSFYGALTLPDGDILCLPRNAHKMIRYTPGDSTVSQVGTAATQTVGFGGFCLAPNGSVYVIPEADTVVYKYDPVANTMTSIATGISNRYKGATTDNTGNIIAAPHNASNFLHIDTSTDTVSTKTYGATGLSGTTPFLFGCHTLPNGNVLALGYKVEKFYEINGKEETLTEHPTAITDPTMLAGAYGGNDIFFCANASKDKVVRFRTNANTSIVSANTQFTFAIQPVGTGSL